MKACMAALFLCSASLLLRGLAAEPTPDEKYFEESKAKAEKGDAEAQFKLGYLYDLGRGVVKDEAEAVNWYRKAADQGYANAQAGLGRMYSNGLGVAKDEVEALKWYRKSADQGNPFAQVSLGLAYELGSGVAKDEAESVKWYRKAADQGFGPAQSNLGNMYAEGKSVTRDEAEAVKWYRKAADQGYANAQHNLGEMYRRGGGVVKDEVEAYKWYLLAGAQGHDLAQRRIPLIERDLAATQRSEGQKLAREWKPRQATSSDSRGSREGISELRPESSGTGFFITDDGYFITNQHVAGEGAPLRLVTAAGTIAARVVKVDKANDLALLKAEGKFTALPVITSRGVRLGATAATVGFPNTGLQGFAPKLARGEIASLAGAQDDARHFQISAPIQPGNSGGALVDERGNVIGVVVAKLNQRAALATSGALAENVNYAVKSSYLLSFLESVPEVAAKLKEAHTKDRKFEDVVKAVEQATVLVLVY
jgi:TPR repeat protein